GRRRERRYRIRPRYGGISGRFDVGRLRRSLAGRLGRLGLALLLGGGFFRAFLGAFLGRVAGWQCIGFRRLLRARPATFRELLLAGRLATLGAAVDRRLRRNLVLLGLCGGLGLGFLARRHRTLLTALPLSLIRRASSVLLRLLLGVLATLLRQPRVGRAIGDEIARKHAGHIGTGRVMLPQEARQRARWHGLEQAARAFVAGVAGACKKLGRGLAGVEVFLRRRPLRRETAD